MNIYLVTRTDTIGPDEYVAAVVVAPGERRAREEALHLSTNGQQGTTSFLNPDSADCEYIGIARGPVRVVLESLS